MERSKLFSGIAGFFILMILIVTILTMSLCMGIRKNVKNAIFSGTKDAGVFAWNEGDDPEIKFSAVLSQGDIYIYDETGKLFRKVKTYEEFLTSDDKKLLSDGIDFYSEEEMLSFMNDFEG